MSAATVSALISAPAIAPSLPEAAPVQGQLVVANPVLANPVLVLEPLPLMKDVPPGAMPLFDVLADQYRVEQERGVEDHTQTGIDLRATLQKCKDKGLVDMNVDTINQLKRVGSSIDMAAAFIQIERSDLFVHGGPIAPTLDRLDTDVRKHLNDVRGLKGHYFTHTEIKQHCMGLNVMKDVEIAKCEVEIAEEEARTSTHDIDEQVRAHKDTIFKCDVCILQKRKQIDQLELEVAALVSDKNGEETRMSNAQELKVKTGTVVEELMRLAPGIREVKLARLQKTVWGLYHPKQKPREGEEKQNTAKRKLQEGGGKQKLAKLKPSKSALAANQAVEATSQVVEMDDEVAEVAEVAEVDDQVAAKESCLGKGSHRDTGLYKALDVPNTITEPKISLAAVKRALLHTAQGNRLARSIGTLKNMDYDALDDSQLRDVMAQTQAAMAKRAEQQAGPVV